MPDMIGRFKAPLDAGEPVVEPVGLDVLRGLAQMLTGQMTFHRAEPCSQQHQRALHLAYIRSDMPPMLKHEVGRLAGHPCLHVSSL